MSINWKKILFDVLKVVVGAITGASIVGCASIPVVCF